MLLVTLHLKSGLSSATPAQFVLPHPPQLTSMEEIHKGSEGLQLPILDTPGKRQVPMQHTGFKRHKITYRSVLISSYREQLQVSFP